MHCIVRLIQSRGQPRPFRNGARSPQERDVTGWFETRFAMPAVASPMDSLNSVKRPMRLLSESARARFVELSGRSSRLRGAAKRPQTAVSLIFHSPHHMGEVCLTRALAHSGVFK